MPVLLYWVHWPSELVERQVEPNVPVELYCVHTPFEYEMQVVPSVPVLLYCVHTPFEYEMHVVPIPVFWVLYCVHWPTEFVDTQTTDPEVVPKFDGVRAASAMLRPAAGGGGVGLKLTVSGPSSH